MTSPGDGDGATYPCADCGKPLTKAEGGTVFTVCEACRRPDRASTAPAVPGVPTARGIAQRLGDRFSLSPGDVDYIAGVVEADRRATALRHAEETLSARDLAQRRAEQIARLEEAAGIERRRHREELGRVRREALEVVVRDFTADWESHKRACASCHSDEGGKCPFGLSLYRSLNRVRCSLTIPGGAEPGTKEGDR